MIITRLELTRSNTKRTGGHTHMASLKRLNRVSVVSYYLGYDFAAGSQLCSYRTLSKYERERPPGLPDTAQLRSAAS